MGTFFAEVQLASPARPDRRELVKLLVDSGSMYTWVSGALLRELGVEPSERRRVLTIEGRTTERGAAAVMITAAPRSGVRPSMVRTRSEEHTSELQSLA